MASSGITLQKCQKICRVFVSLMVLLVSSFSGIIFLIVPIVPVAVIRPKLAYSLVNSIVIKWFQLAEITLTVILGIRIRTFGDRMTKDSFLFLSNHRCRLDWLFTMALGPAVYDMKYSMKDPLRHAPFFGWAMQFSFFIFLKRNLTEDRERIARLLASIEEMNDEGKLKMLFYPEGTDLSQSNLARNMAYAGKIGREPTQFVLLPRLAGFKEILKTLHDIKTPEVIYDVTIGYPRNVAQSEIDLLAGNYPEEVHFLFKEYGYNDLPFIMGLNGEGLDEESAAKWLDNLWTKKEATLKTFYEAPVEERRFQEQEHCLKDACYEQISNWPTFRGIGVLIFWIMTILMHTLMMKTYLWIKIYSILMPVLFLLADIFCEDGITGLFTKVYSIRLKEKLNRK